MEQYGCSELLAMRRQVFGSLCQLVDCER